MARYERPEFDFEQLAQLQGEAQARLLFDWWCDDADRERYLDQVGAAALIPSRAHVEDDPAPPRTRPAPQGRSQVALVAGQGLVGAILENPDDFSNVPYAELGGASFMLALDPGQGWGDVDWHQQQRDFASKLLGVFSTNQLGQAAECAAQQAAVVGLASPMFDLADYARQAALRYFGLLFGYASADHVLLEDAAVQGYRALQYLIVGRHFTSEPGTLPLAQQALARMSTRTSALIEEYPARKRSPRQPSIGGATRPGDDWPAGVQPWSELGLSHLGDPLLLRMSQLPGALSGQDLCVLTGGLLVGMVGNVQTAVCLMLQELFAQPDKLDALRRREVPREELLRCVRQLMALRPAVPFLPRRTRREVKLGEVTVPAGTDCILAMRASERAGCPWGEGGNGKATHGCLGRSFVEPLLVEIVQRVLALPNLDQLLDGVSGEPLQPERLWGFGCNRYLLRHRADKLRVQQPLIVVMPVKAPIAENAERLRLVVRTAAPRIESVLRSAGIVHVAWFEFLEHDTMLALRTVYDGDFDSYILRFAEVAGDLFDLLFAFIEGAPPIPVADHPYEFVETVRRFNRAPLGGFFYSAYPQQKVADILRLQQAERAR